MESRNADRDELAQLQVIIFQQQETAAKLESAGEKNAARAARERLYPPMHRIDVLKAIRPGS